MEEHTRRFGRAREIAIFSHLTIGTPDLARAIAFYDAVLTPFGIERLAVKYATWASWERPRRGAKALGGVAL